MNHVLRAMPSFAALPGRSGIFLGPVVAMLAMVAALVLDAGKIVPADMVVLQLGLAGLCLVLILPHWAGCQQRTAGAAEQGHVDRHTGLYNLAGWMAAAEELLAGAHRDGRPLSVVVLEFNELRELHEIYGNTFSRKVIADVVRKLEAVAGPQGAVGRTGAAQFTVVLPVPREKALRTIERVLGKTARIEFDAGDDEIVLVPDLILDCTDAGTQSMETLRAGMCLELARRQKLELRRQHYLQRERERHSRPMGVPSPA